MSKVEKEMRRFITLERMKELPKGTLKKACNKSRAGILRPETIKFLKNLDEFERKSAKSRAMIK